MATQFCFCLLFQFVAVAQATELSELESPVIDAGFEKLLQQQPHLCRGGAEAFSTKLHWMTIAVGRAALKTEDGKSLSMSDATKIARVKAHRELAKLIHGFRATAGDKLELKTIESPEKTMLADTFRSYSHQDVDALLTRVEVVGSWRLDEGESVAVMVAVGSAQHPLWSRRAATPAAVQLKNEQWIGNGRAIFTSRPGILTGGASIYRHRDTFYILVVGKSRLQGDAVADRNRDLVASTSAAREAQQFIRGIKLHSKATAVQQQLRLTKDEQTVLDAATETLQTVREEKVAGLIRDLRPVGNWESPDGQLYYAAYAAKLTDLKGLESR